MEPLLSLTPCITAGHGIQNKRREKLLYSIKLLKTCEKIADRYAGILTSLIVIRRFLRHNFLHGFNVFIGVDVLGIARSGRREIIVINIFLTFCTDLVPHKFIFFLFKVESNAAVNILSAVENLISFLFTGKSYGRR